MTHQFDLADLKRMLGINLFLDLDEHALMKTRQQGLVCTCLGLRLSSVFQPIVTRDGAIMGREALLRASSEVTGELLPNRAFDFAVRSQKLVQFDRLVRTIHLLNHANAFDQRELLFLNVHPQLLTSVSDHGRTFEQILHYYSVPITQVAIEITESAVKDDARLEEAMNNYRSVGYRIAVGNFGSGHGALDKLFHPRAGWDNAASMAGLPWLTKVLDLRPDFVKLDGAVIRHAEAGTAAALILHRLVSLFHEAGTQVIAQHIETERQAEIARNAGVDLLQGHYFGCPEFIEARREWA